jgi:hypothetical protein
MKNTMRSLLVLAVCIVAGGCAPVARIEAAGDIHAFLIAVRDDDRAGFNAHVDRRAVEDGLEARMLAQTQQSGEGVRALGAILAHPLSKLAGDALLRPDVFRAVAEYYGYRPGMEIPHSLLIAAALRRLPDGRICATLKHDGSCVITFADEDNVWRLVSFDGDLDMLKPGL